MDADSAAAASSCRVWWNVSLPQLALYMQYRRPSVVMIPRSMRESFFALPRARTVQGRVLCPAGVAARRLGAADAAQSASAEGRRKLRLENLRGTAKALLDSRALETIPIMEYVWERTNRVLANEELLPGRERADGRHVGEERNGACGVLGTSRQGGRMVNDIDRWRQVPPGYGSRPVAMR